MSLSFLNPQQRSILSQEQQELALPPSLHPLHTEERVSPSPYTATNPSTHRTESFILGEGEKKVEMEIETRVPNTVLFTFNKEDHTLGNLLRARLLTYPYVLFSAYQVPHPLQARFVLRVQTDGSVAPRDALLGASRDIVKDLNTLSREFTKEFELKKIAGLGAEGRV